MPVNIDYLLIWGKLIRWPVGLMDKASASGAGDSRFESWAGQFDMPAAAAAQLPVRSIKLSRSQASGP